MYGIFTYICLLCMVHAGIYIYISTIWDTKHTHTHHLFIEVWKSKLKESPKVPAPVFQDPELTKMRPMRLAKFMAETMTTALVTKKTGGNLGNKIPQHQLFWRILED